MAVSVFCSGFIALKEVSRPMEGQASKKGVLADDMKMSA